MTYRGRHPTFAKFYHFARNFGEPAFLREARLAAVAGLTGRVLEIGAGDGANLPYYGPGVDLTLVEPEPFLLAKAAERLLVVGRQANLCLSRAEELPFVGSSFDAVVATLVLCSVDDPVRALQEIRRVLKPSGVFRFVEHVKSHEARRAKAQELLTPIWARMFGNCHLDRATPDMIQRAGLHLHRLEAVNRSRLLPVVMGEANVAATDLCA